MALLPQAEFRGLADILRASQPPSRRGTIRLLCRGSIPVNSIEIFVSTKAVKKMDPPTSGRRPGWPPYCWCCSTGVSGIRTLFQGFRCRPRILAPQVCTSRGRTLSGSPGYRGSACSRANLSSGALSCPTYLPPGQRSTAWDSPKATCYLIQQLGKPSQGNKRVISFRALISDGLPVNKGISKSRVCSSRHPSSPKRRRHGSHLSAHIPAAVFRTWFGRICERARRT